MAETVNIGEIANQLSEDIFNYFFWKSHPRRDENFKCHNPEHLTTGKKPRPKDTHPGDVVFFYEDPYLQKRVYLHTDLKSYGKDSVGPVKLRAAIESLSMTVECATSSGHWRDIYSVTGQEPYEIRGLLFVHNHDHKYVNDFQKAVQSANLPTVPVAANVYIHFLGPSDINRLFTIANDLVRLMQQKAIPEKYSFYYPDLVMFRRKGDVMEQPATIEAMTAPFFIIKFAASEKADGGYLIYYNRRGESHDEFEYFLDCLSRYQMLEPEESIKIRIVHPDPHPDHMSNFRAARERYIKAWGFDEARASVLQAVDIRRVTAVTDTYSVAQIGWRAGK